MGGGGRRVDMDVGRAWIMIDGASEVTVVSITEHADDSPTGKLMEAIIESVDEFYSANLAEGK